MLYKYSIYRAIAYYRRTVSIKFNYLSSFRGKLGTNWDRDHDPEPDNPATFSLYPSQTIKVKSRYRKIWCRHPDTDIIMDRDCVSNYL